MDLKIEKIIELEKENAELKREIKKLVNDYYTVYQKLEYVKELLKESIN